MKYSEKYSKSTPRSALEVEYSKKLSKRVLKKVLKRSNWIRFFFERERVLKTALPWVTSHKITGCPKKVSDSDVVLIPSSAAWCSCFSFFMISQCASFHVSIGSLGQDSVQPGTFLGPLVLTLNRCYCCCCWSSRGVGLLQMIIQWGRPPASNYLEGLASSK